MEKKEHKIFIFDRIKVFFKHTDYYGYVHPYNYLEWTSYVREAFFSQMCGDFYSILDSPIKMMTSKINLTMYDDCVFGDEIEARFTTLKIKKISFDVIVRFIKKKTPKVICETQHTLVYVDSRSQKFNDIPKGIKDAVVEYEEKNI